MASDSLFGGSTDLTQVVSSSSLDLINAFLTDTVGGSAITGVIGDSTIVIGSGSDGEKQGALLPSGSAISGSIDDGVLKLDIQVPAGSGFVFEGKDHASADTVGAFLNSIIDAYLPPDDPATPQVLRDGLTNAVNDLVNSMKALGVTDIVVRMIDFVSGNNLPSLSALGPHDVLLDVSATAGGNEAFFINLHGLGVDDTLVLTGIENVMLAGQGRVRVDGDTPVVITNDGGNQDITGGGGNDTLIGGGGNDTLTGGAGDDTFGFRALGHYKIEDFAKGHDHIAFKVGGIDNVFELLPYLTGVTQNTEGVTLDFGPNFSLTLVGISAADITADMIKFTF